MRTDYGYFEEQHLAKPYDLRLLKRLYPFVQPYRMLLAGVVLLVLLITLLELALPLVTRHAIDRYIVPVENLQATAGGKERAVSEREYRTDINDPAVADVVDRYPSLFRTDGDAALIALSDLEYLDPRDLSKLRGADFDGIARMTLLFLALILASFAFNFIQVVLMEYAGQTIMHNLRLRLFGHIQELSLAFFARNPVGRLVTRVTNDVQNMDELFTSVIAFVFKDVIMLAGITMVMVSINWQLALTTFAVVPLVIIASVHFSKKAREVFRELRVQVAEINTRFAESIGGMKIIQLYGQQQANYELFARLNHANYLTGMRQIRVLGVFLPAVEMLGIVAVAVVIYSGGRGVLAGIISLGDLVAFIAYLKMFFRPVRDIAEKYNVLQNAMASAERIFLVLDNDERIPPPPLTGPNIPRLEHIRTIEMDRVSFGYLPSDMVLKQISFKLRAGEKLALVGPTGSGKTTIINLLTRFYDPSEGCVRFNGLDLRRYNPATLREPMALVQQDPFLFSESLRRNIFQDNHVDGQQEVDRVLEAANCRGFIEQLPQGLDTVLSEGGASLSSGQRQLVSIARALARNPELIILDEATSYIDSATEAKVQEAVANLLRGRTAIIVAHRLSTARNADRILVINRGRIIEAGTHAALMEQRGFYYRLNQLEG